MLVQHWLVNRHLVQKLPKSYCSCVARRCAHWGPWTELCAVSPVHVGSTARPHCERSEFCITRVSNARHDMEARKGNRCSRIAVPCLNLSDRVWWVGNATSLLLYCCERDPVPIWREAEWVTVPGWISVEKRKSLAFLPGVRKPIRTALSESLERLRSPDSVFLRDMWKREFWEEGIEPAFLCVLPSTAS
jgi:hypothetical protein